MANCAAHLVDRVVPDVPLRQFVLSLPFELRRLAAFKQDVLGAIVRIFTDAVFANYRARAKREGIEGCKGGAVTFLQRFGGSLNLNLHLHVAFLDGVFTRDEEQRIRFHPAGAPDAADLQAIAQRVHMRVTAWLRRHGYLDAKPIEERSNEAAEQGALEACAGIAMQRGAFAKLDAKAPDTETVAGATNGEAPKLRFAAEHEGFNLHAGVHITAADDMGRERLFRYGARPALALDRLRRLPDGRIAYRVKHAGAGRAKHRVMTSLEFLARIAAILPPPRFPLIRFHGVLAPRSSWRKEIVPRPREPKTCTTAKRKADDDDDGKCKSQDVKVRAAHRPAAPVHASDSKSSPSPPPPMVHGARPTDTQRSPAGRSPAASVLPGALAPILLAPSILAVAHWNRLMAGLLYCVSPRLSWSQLLRRTFATDVEECPKCHGRLRVVRSITEPAVAHAILDRLGMPIDAPTAARARDPTDDDVCDDG